jgi:hypothetical protein
LTAPIRRILVRIEPSSWELARGGDVHKMRLEVQTSDTVYATETLLRPDDFTSRFDLMFEYAVQAIKRQLKKPELREGAQ